MPFTSVSATHSQDCSGSAETKGKNKNKPILLQMPQTYPSSREQYRRKRRTPSLCDAQEKPNLSALSRKYRTHRVGHGLLRRTEQSPVPVNKTPKRWLCTFQKRDTGPDSQHPLHLCSALQMGKKARVSATEDSFLVLDHRCLKHREDNVGMKYFCSNIMSLLQKD